MSGKKQRYLKLVFIFALLAAVVFAPAAVAGIATSPLGVHTPTVLAGLGSCPLGSRP